MSVKGRMGGEQPDHPSCSQSAHDQNVLASMRAGKDSLAAPLEGEVGENEKNGRVACWPPVLAQRAASEGLVGRAQWEAKQATLL